MARVGYVIGRLDWVLVLAMSVLIAIGLAAMYSVDLSQGGGYGMRQGVFALVGLGVFFLCGFVHIRWYQRHAVLLWIASTALLVLVLVAGKTVRGLTGWFELGPVSVQPVELAKIGLICILAAFWSRHGVVIGWRTVCLSLVILASFVIPVLLQPDLGSALILIAIWGGMMMVVRTPWRILLTFVGGGIAMALCAWFFVLAPYQKDRILVFLDPSRDPRGSGYNVIQSTIAVGSGGLMGKGLGFGSQSQLRFIPESQTDFVFAVLAEELGFVASLGIISLYAVMLYRCYVHIQNIRDNFAGMVLVGVIMWIGVQSFINIGMNSGMLPVTGITLPFISYGGSSLVALLIMMGVTQSAIAHSPLTDAHYGADPLRVV